MLRLMSSLVRINRSVGVNFMKIQRNYNNMVKVQDFFNKEGLVVSFDRKPAKRADDKRFKATIEGAYYTLVKGGSLHFAEGFGSVEADAFVSLCIIISGRSLTIEEKQIEVPQLNWDDVILDFDGFLVSTDKYVIEVI